jgi:hypothetical protein
MALTMRPAGLSSGIDQDRADYTVFCGEWNIGGIYEVRGGPEHLRWFWAFHFPSKPESLRTDNRVATLDVAKAEFEGELAAMAGVGKATRRGAGLTVAFPHSSWTSQRDAVIDTKLNHGFLRAQPILRTIIPHMPPVLRVVQRSRCALWRSLGELC